MANLDKSLETLDTSLEKNKKILNPLLKDYLSERIWNKKENSKKEAFLEKFNTLPIEEKKEYRDYLYNVVKESPDFMKDFNDDFIQVIKLVSSIDKLEIYAWVCNNCKVDTSKEWLFKEPNFFVTSWLMTNTKTNKTLDFEDLKGEYTWAWTYKLYLDDLLLESWDYFLIWANEKWWIVVYNKDGSKEFESNKTHWKIKFESKTKWVKIELNVLAKKD